VGKIEVPRPSASASPKAKSQKSWQMLAKSCQQSCQKAVKNCQKLVNKLSKSFQKVVKKLSKKLLKFLSYLLNRPENKNWNGNGKIIGIP
jgi:hypothetical protein